MNSMNEVNASKMNHKVKVMYWDREGNDTRWLDYSVVGVLKTFTDASLVVKTLLNSQVFFNFYNMGNKNTLWDFRSLKDRYSFINNKALWKDYFSSVTVWKNVITPQARLAWVEFRGIPLDCWCENFFQRLGWAMGEPMMIAEDTLNRDNLYNGRVLVLIPFRQKCLEFIKVQLGRRTFSESVWEYPTQISYSNILRWLDLYWYDHVGQLSPGIEKSKKTVYRPKRTKCDKGLGEAELFCLGKEKNIYGELKSNNSKGKEVGRSLVFKKGVMKGSKPSSDVTSSFEESESGRIVISPKYKGETSKGGLGHVVRGNIIIDLGCGLIDERGNGLSNAQALKVLNKPNQSDVKLLKRAYFKLDLDGLYKA
ncbi:hypothetical protein LWI28_012327 [Acer negundo]|uniref:DUF4283 domain-containing protein n=1 Tax=Acer negundo TaxID=4023 RepID=A0AAD5ILH8_ACENE|nr:hypothetical protein LWI28_012327 [Acer negundo]